MILILSQCKGAKSFTELMYSLLWEAKLSSLPRTASRGCSCSGPPAPAVCCPHRPAVPSALQLRLLGAVPRSLECFFVFLSLGSSLLAGLIRTVTFTCLYCHLDFVTCPVLRVNHFSPTRLSSIMPALSKIKNLCALILKIIANLVCLIIEKCLMDSPCLFR